MPKSQRVPSELLQTTSIFNKLEPSDCRKITNGTFTWKKSIQKLCCLVTNFNSAQERIQCSSTALLILPSPAQTWRRSEIPLGCLIDILDCWCPTRKGQIPWETKKTPPVKSYWSCLQQSVWISLSLLIHGWQEYPKSTCSSPEGFICTSHKLLWN